MKTAVKIPLIILLVVCIGVFLFSGYKFWDQYSQYKDAEAYADQLSQDYVSVAEATPEPDDNADSVEVNENSNEEACPISVDFNNLLAANNDVCGWIYSPDTVINYVVVQQPADSSYDPKAVSSDEKYPYLHHKLDGSYSVAGTLFIDPECSPNFSGANTIIYGHNMKNGSMFASLHNYVDQSYYDAHPFFYISTPSCDYKVDIFSCFTCDYDADTYTLSFASEEEYSAFLSKMASKSNVKTDVAVDSTERIVTLSTCTYEYDNARYVVLGKLVPIAQDAA